MVKPFALKKNQRKNRKKGGRGRTSQLDKNVVEMQPEYPAKYFSHDAKDFLQGLLKKEPTERLGFNGIGEIKNHAWFQAQPGKIPNIDFGLLEAGYIAPPFVPDDLIAKESDRQVGPPPGDEKYKDFVLSDAFQESLAGFPYMSYKSIQQEMVDVLKQTKAHHASASQPNRFAIPEPPKPGDFSVKKAKKSKCTIM